jgi:hypothetical protein
LKDIVPVPNVNKAWRLGVLWRYKNSALQSWNLKILNTFLLKCRDATIFALFPSWGMRLAIALTFQIAWICHSFHRLCLETALPTARAGN